MVRQTLLLDIINELICTTLQERLTEWRLFISLNVFPTQAGQTAGDSSDPSSAEQPG